MYRCIATSQLLSHFLLHGLECLIRWHVETALPCEPDHGLQLRSGKPEPRKAVEYVQQARLWSMIIKALQGCPERCTCWSGQGHHCSLLCADSAQSSSSSSTNSSSSSALLVICLKKRTHQKAPLAPAALHPRCPFLLRNSRYVQPAGDRSRHVPPAFVARPPRATFRTR